MKRLQENILAKGLATVLLAASVFCGSMSAFQALAILPYAEVDGWQETSRFYNLLWERERMIAEGVARTLALEDEAELTYLDRQQIQEALEHIHADMDREATWFRYRLLTEDGETLLSTNLAEDQSLAELVGTIHYASFVAGEYWVAREEDSARAQESAEPSDVLEDSAPTLIIECGVPMDLSGVEFTDEFAELARQYEEGRAAFPGCLQLMFLLAGVAVVCLLYLLWVSGHKEGSAGVVPSWQEKIYLEFYLLVMAAVGTAALVGIFYLGDYFYSYSFYQAPPEENLFRTAKLLASVLVVVLAGAVTLTLRTLAVRLKAECLLRTTLVCRLAGAVWHGVREVIRAMPFLWRTIVGFVVFFFLNVMFFQEARYDSWMGAGWWLLNLAVLGLVCWWAIGFQRLQKGGRAISAGNLSYQIDTRRLPGDLRRHAEDLNNLSAGMSEAVEEKMKSERFKAELITNVSHDLKTPLTSIINYVNLLKTTRQDDPKAVEYIEVLDRKSQRLKKLTEDLVEASKASTGVLNVNREKIGMGQLIDQALGEWAEKLKERKLTIITTLPEGETWVYADGRHLWRVIDNLLSNCAKYAMEGTRVYLDLARGKGQVVLSVKNISREALNVPSERLMERFVRGEESRSTEGSGLGLSIARSLTELQGGSFELAVDGDLFKAIVTLTQAN